MFLNKILKRNEALVHYGITMHQSGEINPDTYVIDLDAVLDNASAMLEQGRRFGTKLFFMTKQFGRNPLIAKELVAMGYEGAVAVDFNEAITLHEHGVPLCHVGHLVQVPTRLVERVVAMKPQFITIYSIDKAREINEACWKLGLKQQVLLRIVEEGDVLYPAQYGGFTRNELPVIIPSLLQLEHIKIAGLTSFPCFLYDTLRGDIMPTPNVETLKQATLDLQDLFALELNELNLPSATCSHSIPIIASHGGTQAEPGHGLLGTTPMHAEHDLVEQPAIIYVSEISHTLGNRSYCYGGGYYSRSGLEQAFVSNGSGYKQIANMIPHISDSIDYYLELEGSMPVGASVIMAFRTQIFVTRSTVAVVKGLASGHPQLVGLYDSNGRVLKEYVR